MIVLDKTILKDIRLDCSNFLLIMKKNIEIKKLNFKNAELVRANYTQELETTLFKKDITLIPPWR